MEDLLILLRVIQERKIKHRLGSQILTRYNPCNPLSYVSIIVEILLSLVLYGILGTFKHIKNPFKYR